MDLAEMFWDVASKMIEDGKVQTGTMMGFECLRAQGEFVAMADSRGDQIVIKLPAKRVTELIELGDAASFAPAGKVFKEWAAIRPNRFQLEELLLESVEFVRAG